MTVRTDTNALLTYNPNGYPALPGGEALYLTNELRKASNTINKLVAVVKQIEKRLNDNALT